MNDNCENVKSGEAFQEHVVSIWRHEVLGCSKCWDADNHPILKPSRQVKGSQDLRWRNRHRVPHIGTDFGVNGPRVIFVGLEDPYLRNADDPANAMIQLGAYLTTTQSRDLDCHRRGELHLAHDLFGFSGDSTGSAIFKRVATINSHPCSLVSGDGRQSASDKLLHTCDLAWRIIFTELMPNIVVLEGKKLVWDEARAEVTKRGWPIKRSRMSPGIEQSAIVECQRTQP